MSKAAKKEVREKTIRGIELPPMKELEAFLKSLSYVTPSMLAENSRSACRWRRTSSPSSPLRGF